MLIITTQIFHKFVILFSQPLPCACGKIKVNSSHRDENNDRPRFLQLPCNFESLVPIAND
ncbi:MAG: hypothetical protein RMZ69_01620 [Nostoc sp. ChiQUE01a]|nr:hypothetical protein [Nostoc sp. DedQUE01]MDZ8235869.1 hypothetical protein [Nostoc sp. ChiQUE01a]